MATTTVDIREIQEEQALREGKKDFETFFRLYPPSRNYKFGRHTMILLNKLNEVPHALELGRCVYLCVCMPFRHGKSDIVSRRFPAWTMLGWPELEIILASYNYQLATAMAYEDRQLFREVGQHDVFDLSIRKDKSSVDAWGIEGHKGAMFSAGIGGTITGRGADILIIDDYLKNRAEADSETVRSNVWDSFQSDLMSRLAPVHAVVIVANRWHVDDLVGRIQRRNNPKDPLYDKEFPKFEMLKFPAQNPDGTWLFPERFSDHWYKTERASLGTYAWNAQGQQEPKVRSGNLLKTNNVHIVDDMPEGLTWVRAWDPASTEKQRIKDDPDYTVGTKVAFVPDGHGVGKLYVADVERGQWSATTRDDKIEKTAERDGPGVMVYVEVVGGYVDLYEHLRVALSGKATVRKFIPKGDKVTRAGVVEPFFEAGNVYLLRGDWNEAWMNEHGEFPESAHDDQVDSFVMGCYNAITEKGRMKIFR